MHVLDSKILVAKEEQQEEAVEKIGGFVIPSGNKSYDVYKVVSVGDKIESLKEGEVIYTYPNPGTELKLAEGTYRVISLPDILVVL